MVSPLDLERDPRVVDLASSAREMVQLVASLVAAPAAGGATHETATRLANRLLDQHRTLVDSGVPASELLGAASAAGDDPVGVLAADPRLALDLAQALPRLTAVTPAEAAATPAFPLDTWLEHASEAMRQDAGAALATLTMPGRTVTAVSASARQHPERKVLDLLAADHHAELLSASTLTLVTTAPMCPACCVALLRLLATFPRLHAVVSTFVEPVAAEPDDSSDEAPPVVTVVAADAPAAVPPAVTPPAAVPPAAVTPEPVAVTPPAAPVAAVDPDALRATLDRLAPPPVPSAPAGQGIDPDELRATLDRLAPPPVPSAPAEQGIDPDELRATLDRLAPPPSGPAVTEAPAPVVESEAAELTIFDDLDDAEGADDDVDPADEVPVGLDLGEDDPADSAGQDDLDVPWDPDEDEAPDLADDDDDDDDDDDADFSDAELPEDVDHAEPGDPVEPPSAEVPPAPAAVPAPEPATSAPLPEAPPADPTDPRERDVALLVQRLHDVVRFLPTFAAVADQSQAVEANLELQRLAGRVAERYEVLGAPVGDLPDGEVDRLPNAYGLDMAGTRDDATMAEWETALTRQLLRDTRLSVGGRTDGTVTVLTGQSLAGALARLRVAAPADPSDGPDPSVAREWQQVVKDAGEGQAALATLRLPTGDTLTIMTASGKGLVEAYVGGKAVPRKGRLPRYLSYPPSGDDGPARHLDAEKQLLDYLGTNHHADLDQGVAAVTLVCTEAMCPSCCYVALQFLADFPTVGGLTVQAVQSGQPARGLRRFLSGSWLSEPLSG